VAQGEGWPSREWGRFVEGAGEPARLLDVHFSGWESTPAREDVVNAYLDWVGLLKWRTAFEAYCQVYTAALQPVSIAEFLLLDAEFPQTVRFAAEMVQAALVAIARLTGGRSNRQAERWAGRLCALLEYAEINEIMANGLHVYLADVQRFCAEIHHQVHRPYLAPPLEAVLER